MATKSNSLLLDPQLHSFARAYMWQLLRQGKFAEPATEPLHVLAQELAQAIALEDKKAFKGISGVGSKTVERILLDLKDKLLFTPTTTATMPPKPSAEMCSPRNTMATMDDSKGPEPRAIG